MYLVMLSTGHQDRSWGEVLGFKPSLPPNRLLLYLYTLYTFSNLLANHRVSIFYLPLKNIFLAMD